MKDNSLYKLGSFASIIVGISCAVMFPLAGRVLVSGALMAWTRALGEFGATILFAGNLEGTPQTMPLAIYLRFERNLDVAVVLSVVLVMVSLIHLAVMHKLDDNQAH
jgi:molybdate transport system permease protein